MEDSKPKAFYFKPVDDVNRASITQSTQTHTQNPHKISIAEKPNTRMFRIYP